MPFATGAQTSIAYVAESTWGTTPATPSLTSFPVTSWNMRNSKEVYESKDIRSDRQVVDVRHGFRAALLDFGFEVKHNNFDWLLRAALFSADWSSHVIKGGTTRWPTTIEGSYGNISLFGLGTGFLVNQLGLKVTTSGIVTATCSMIGKTYTLSGSSVDAGGGYTAPSSRNSMTAFSASLTEGGSAIAVVTAIDVNLDNGLEPAKIVGSTTAADVFDGRQRVTGKLSAFFQNATLYNKFLNETASSLAMTFTDPGSNTLQISLPNIKYTATESNVDGESGLVLDMPFTALYDNTQQTSIVVTRSA